MSVMYSHVPKPHIAKVDGVWAVSKRSFVINADRKTGEHFAYTSASIFINRVLRGAP